MRSPASCAPVNGFAEEVVRWIVDYRMTLLLIIVTTINVSLEAIRRHVLPRLNFVERFSEDVKSELGVRLLQLVFGALFCIFGYGCVFVEVVTGCESSKLFLFCMAWIMGLDFHEYIRRWPLKAPVLGHHLMVFFLALTFAEYGSELDGFRGLLTAIVISNICLLWVTDYFHVVFRTSKTATSIRRARTLYLALASLRVCCCLVFAAAVLYNASTSAWLYMVSNMLLGTAYAYNMVKAVSFVWHFEVDAYFATHQALWLSPQEEIGEVAGQRKLPNLLGLGDCTPKGQAQCRLKTPKGQGPGSLNAESMV